MTALSARYDLTGTHRARHRRRRTAGTSARRRAGRCRRARRRQRHRPDSRPKRPSAAVQGDRARRRARRRRARRDVAGIGWRGWPTISPAAASPIDILVNNAAIDPKVTSTPGVMHSSRFEAFPVPQWQTEIAVGLTGAMLCAQVFGGAMAAARPRRDPQHRIRSRRDRAGSAALPAAPHRAGGRAAGQAGDLLRHQARPDRSDEISRDLLGGPGRARQRDFAGRRLQQPGPGFRRTADAADPDGTHGPRSTNIAPPSSSSARTHRAT